MLLVNDLAGKVAVVTGAARGIGAASADILAEHGAAVLLTDIREEEGQAHADRLVRAGKQASFLCLDMADRQSARRMIRRAVELYGRIDIFYNNAGIINATPRLELELEVWDRVIAVNQTGTYLCLVEEMNFLIQQGQGGRIINASSQAGETGGSYSPSAYVASKHAILGLTRAYANVGAPYGILVNCICPGLIKTDMLGDRNDPSLVPIGRIGTAEDCANSVYFLASELSSFITGARIDINGGTFQS